MWFREVELPAVIRAAKVPYVAAFVVAIVMFGRGGAAFAGAVGQEQPNSQTTPSSAIVIDGPGVEQTYAATPDVPASRHASAFVIPATALADSLSSAPKPATAKFADDGYRASLLDAVTPPASSASQSMIPTVQAFAAATGAADLGRRMIFDAPAADQSESPQQLIPLPPAGWTGMMGLVSLGIAGKLRRLRRRF